MRIQRLLEYISHEKINLNLTLTIICTNKDNDHIYNVFIDYRKGVLYTVGKDSYTNSKLTVSDLVNMLQKERDKSIELCLISNYKYFNYFDCHTLRENDSEHFGIVFKEIKKPKIIIDENLPDNEVIRENYLGDIKCLYNDIVDRIS